MSPPVGVGVIGAGSCLGEYLVVLDRLIATGKATEGPICARRREAWPALLERRPAAQLVTDPAEVAESDVGVIVVITRDDSHAGYVRLALEHGKHVIVERPIAMTLDEAQALARLARERKLQLISGPVVHTDLWISQDSDLRPTIRISDRQDLVCKTFAIGVGWA